MHAKLIPFAVACLIGLAGCDGESASAPEPFERVDRAEGQTMGTFYAVTVPGGYEGGSSALKNEADAAFDEVCDAISTFDSKAELARFNEHRSLEPFEISPLLARIIEEVQHEARRIDFATDITVGPLVNLWGFGPEGKPEKIPTPEQLSEVRTFTGPDKFELRQGKIPFLKKVDPRVRLDLSTVGEGLGADSLAARLDRQGVKHYMVAVAGAIRSKGLNPQGKPWRVGIENPLNPGQRPFAEVCPVEMAMSTSGTYRNFFVDEKTGQRYSHIIDPRSGAPISHRTVSVTVIAPSALMTDTLDTGLMVMGADAALEWGEKNEMAVYTIEIDDKGEPVGRHTRYMQQYLDCKVPAELTRVKD